MIHYSPTYVALRVGWTIDDEMWDCNACGAANDIAIELCMVCATDRED
jgi:hypothetical protein